MTEELTIQIHLNGIWLDAASVLFSEPDRGIRGRTRVSYNDDFYFDLNLFDEPENTVIDRRALSVRRPVNLQFSYSDRWPAWLLDLMPQGAARQRIAREAGFRPDDPAVELKLLMRAGGSPIGNMRIREAWEAEQKRIADVDCPPLTDEDLRTRSELFLDVVNRFAHLASGSSGVQGEWPKALMTRSARDGFWYPDPFVPTDEGAEHLIVKLLRSSNLNDTLILEAEAPYLELARAFGLKVGAPLAHENNVLRIPRFDRAATPNGVKLHGQESLVSALGVAEFGHIAAHEDYLQIIRDHSDDPIADTLEYVMRDILNLATGNPDNHGRNSALTKWADGGIRLSPLFDYTPMRLSDAGIARVTNWKCMDGRDLGGGFLPICETAPCDGLTCDDVRNALISKLPMLRELDDIALDLGVPPAVVKNAFTIDRAIRAIEELEDSPCPE